MIVAKKDFFILTDLELIFFSKDSVIPRPDLFEEINRREVLENNKKQKNIKEVKENVFN